MSDVTTSRRLMQRTRTQSMARRFEADLFNLIKSAREGGDLRWTAVCLDLLGARKTLATMMHPNDVAGLEA